MKEYKKLGFSEEETAEIVEALNKLLANLQVHYQKLRNFHWNVEGPNFFELHDQFELEYDQVKIQIDEIAERIRVFGHKPLSTMADYLKVAEIEEAETDLSSQDMVAQIIQDFEFLLSFMMDAVEAASEIDDNATEDQITGYMKRTEQRHWMFSAWAK
ncbi:MAG: DNA starvation/stationary phase protection protein [Saprospirales bacterium]|nr:MAG: DNA starvation/stationary phase protection protein [Saprospirales bacterium]